MSLNEPTRVNPATLPCELPEAAHRLRRKLPPPLLRTRTGRSLQPPSWAPRVAGRHRDAWAPQFDSLKARLFWPPQLHHPSFRTTVTPRHRPSHIWAWSPVCGRKETKRWCARCKQSQARDRRMSPRRESGQLRIKPVLFCDSPTINHHYTDETGSHRIWPGMLSL